MFERCSISKAGKINNIPALLLNGSGGCRSPLLNLRHAQRATFLLDDYQSSMFNYQLPCGAGDGNRTHAISLGS
jgi:hypothetical protein